MAEIKGDGHIGSWGLPDYGWTEKIAAKLGKGYMPQTNDGGSNLLDFVGSKPTTQWQTPGGAIIRDPGVVLGKSDINTAPATQNNTNTNKPQGPGGGGGDFMQFYQGWDPGSALADFKAQYGGDINKLMAAKGAGGGGFGYEDQSGMISEMYEPFMQELNKITGFIDQNKINQLGNIDQDYLGTKGLISQEETDLLGNISSQGESLEKGERSAYADAVRAYNNLIQQGLSRYGTGSSAGGAISELVGQEFMRNVGKMKDTVLEGKNQLAVEGTKVKSYVSQKMVDLDKWKRDAVTLVNENFQNKMYEIAMRKGELEANKTRDKIALLQQTIDGARAIQQRDMEFKNNLASFAVEQMQKFSGRALNPKEIAKVVNDMIGQDIRPLTANAGAGANSYVPYVSRMNNDDDALSQLNPSSVLG